MGEGNHMGEERLVADLVVERLRAWGVHRIFGYSGDGINGVMGALRRAGGDPAKFGTAYPALVGGSYTSMWWVYPGNDGVIAARGVHGQTIYVDPAAHMVLVRFASFPKAENPLIDPTSIPAFRAVAAYLKSQ